MIRSAPLRRTSKGLCATKRQQRRAYHRAEPSACRACGSWERLENSHHFPQGRYPEHRNNMANVVTLCHDCHTCWENNKPRFKAEHPDAWQVKLDIMQALEPGYFELFQLKNPTLFPC